MITQTKLRLANISLFALTISFLILLGGGNYEAINITHTIASAPPKSLTMLQGPTDFFRYFSGSFFIH